MYILSSTCVSIRAFVFFSFHPVFFLFREYTCVRDSLLLLLSYTLSVSFHPSLFYPSANTHLPHVGGLIIVQVFFKERITRSMFALRERAKLFIRSCARLQSFFLPLPPPPPSPPLTFFFFSFAFSFHLALFLRILGFASPMLVSSQRWVKRGSSGWSREKRKEENERWTSQKPSRTTHMQKTLFLLRLADFFPSVIFFPSRLFLSLSRSVFFAVSLLHAHTLSEIAACARFSFPFCSLPRQLPK